MVRETQIPDCLEAFADDPSCHQRQQYINEFAGRMRSILPRGPDPKNLGWNPKVPHTILSGSPAGWTKEDLAFGYYCFLDCCFG